MKAGGELKCGRFDECEESEGHLASSPVVDQGSGNSHRFGFPGRQFIYFRAISLPISRLD